jgi:hypothetical protein
MVHVESGLIADRVPYIRGGSGERAAHHRPQELRRVALVLRGAALGNVVVTID